MQRHLGRAELVDRLLPDLHTDGDGPPEDRLLQGFARAVLRRVDAAYLYKHRLTTLGAQLRDSWRWVYEVAPSDGVAIRVFRPTDEAHGYSLDGWVIETAMADQPFIVDTMKLWIEQQGIRVHNAANVILPAVVGDEGRIVAFSPRASGLKSVSYTRWYAEWPDGASTEALMAALRERLELSRATVRDFHRMVREVKDVSNAYEYLTKAHPDSAPITREVGDFLQWLADDHFVFMGVSVYERDDDGAFQLVPERGLGIARGVTRPSGDLTERTLAFFEGASRLARPMVRVRKSPENSQVHRAGKIDEVMVRTFDDAGNPRGGCVVHGMFTFKGLNQPGTSIPILRRQFEDLWDEAMVAGSYEHKGLVNAYNILPVEFLFEAEPETLRSLLTMSVSADDTRQVHTQVVVDPNSRGAYTFVMVPKTHYSDELRVELQRLLTDELDASYVDHRVHLAKYGTVALHFYLTGDRGFDEANLARVEGLLVDAATPWTARLRERLELDLGDAQAGQLYGRYADAFPEGYQELTPVEVAVVDLQHLTHVADSGDLRFDVFEAPGPSREAYIRIYSREELSLTRILPVVDNFGVVVHEQFAFDVVPAGGTGRLVVNTLRVDRGDPDLLQQRVALVDAFRAVFARRMRSDRLNRLLLAARLDWREVDLLRAYYHYSRQLGHGLVPETVHKVLLAHTPFVATLAELFRRRFDPDLARSLNGQADAAQAKLVDRLEKHLASVNGFEEDRILRTFLNLVQATMRTNFYRRQAEDVPEPMKDGEHFISLKLRSADVREMPEPRPMYEIWVHHSRVEGIHLRGGTVARGGLRWSDRLDDFRSEILGLMATQMLKNALIVPVGAKGGFVLTEPVDDPAEGRQRADSLYRIFIRGLLEVTDNRVGDRIESPPRVVRYDGDDPYLVVAADKGTAHLSDTANEVARAFKFWLGDAFASGGSVGYDHKVKGITARGAWVCVRRHFAEIGLDPERDAITTVGIGDMSGDVFGNGMLLSRSMKLVAAFNHRHVFIDPDPDPEASFLERQRLFGLGRTSWTDYDASVISAGGGVFDRGAKAIELSAQAKERLQTSRGTLSGEELIKLILCADVDLLWNGGIGTYVKGSKQTHQDVEDSANDRVRVDASEVRARVIGEGGNLGVTMRGRVEYASLGGRINTDAIDNSGGVDLSDHEVNLKILLAPLMRGRRLKKADRDALLAAVGDEVCDSVLDNNETQSLALSLDELRSRRDIWAFVRATNHLRDAVGFSRRMERLPRDKDLIDHRVATKSGFLRPELAKLLAYTKRLVYPALLERPLGSDATLLDDVAGYFPPSVVEAHAKAVETHMLYREIAATVATNRIVDRAGAAFFPRMLETTERSVTDVAAGYLLAERMLDARTLRGAIDALDPRDIARGQYEALVALEDALTEAVTGLLEGHPDALDLDRAEALARELSIGATLVSRWPQLLPAVGVRALRATADEHVARGVPADLAQGLVGRSVAAHAPAIAQVATRMGWTDEDAARTFFRVAFSTQVLPFVQAIQEQVQSDRWDQAAITTIVAAIRRVLVQLCELVATKGGGAPRAVGSVDRHLRDMPGLEALRRELTRTTQERISVSAMLVLSERLRRLVDDAARRRDGA